MGGLEVAGVDGRDKARADQTVEQLNLENEMGARFGGQGGTQLQRSGTRLIDEIKLASEFPTQVLVEIRC